jgi:hypothetical protein
VGKEILHAAIEAINPLRFGIEMDSTEPQCSHRRSETALSNTIPPIPRFFGMYLGSTRASPTSLPQFEQVISLSPYFLKQPNFDHAHQPGPIGLLYDHR